MTISELYANEISVAVQLMRNGAGRESSKSPVILHCSDLHKGKKELDRILQFAGENKWLITDILHTGDSVSRRFSDAMPAFSTPGAEKVLNIVGNHDALGDDTGWDWSKRVSDEVLYNMIFKPFCANWDVAIFKNTTYWYKDYATFNFRLIGIDSTLGSNSLQVSWLKDTLFSAKSLGYSVVIATHYPPENRIKVPCGFTSLINDYQGSGLFGAMDEQIQIVVQDFIDCGGEFVCYLSGHTHTDYIWFNKNFPEQLCITVDSANAFHSNLFGDTYRVADTKSEDLFNLFSFDPQLKIVKIVRIGANANSILQLKNAIAINYKTMEVL